MGELRREREKGKEKRTGGRVQLLHPPTEEEEEEVEVGGEEEVEEEKGEFGGGGGGPTGGPKRACRGPQRGQERVSLRGPQKLCGDPRGPAKATRRLTEGCEGPAGALERPRRAPGRPTEGREGPMGAHQDPVGTCEGPAGLRRKGPRGTLWGLRPLLRCLGALRPQGGP